MKAFRVHLKFGFVKPQGRLQGKMLLFYDGCKPTCTRNWLAVWFCVYKGQFVPARINYDINYLQPEARIYRVLPLVSIVSSNINLLDEKASECRTRHAADSTCFCTDYYLSLHFLFFVILISYSICNF